MLQRSSILLPPDLDTHIATQVGGINLFFQTELQCRRQHELQRGGTSPYEVV